MWGRSELFFLSRYIYCTVSRRCYVHRVSEVCGMQYSRKLHHFRALFTKGSSRTSFLRNTSVGENELVQAQVEREMVSSTSKHGLSERSFSLDNPRMSVTGAPGSEQRARCIPAPGPFIRTARNVAGGQLHYLRTHQLKWINLRTVVICSVCLFSWSLPSQDPTLCNVLVFMSTFSKNLQESRDDWCVLRLGKCTL